MIFFFCVNFEIGMMVFLCLASVIRRDWQSDKVKAKEHRLAA